MSEKTSEIPKGWNYPAFDAKGKVMCQICGKSFMILTPSHLKTHDLKYSEYKNKFPGAPITTEEFKALSKYSKPSKYTEEDMNILGKETVIEDDVPVIDDDFEIPQIHVAKKFDNPMDAKKHEIFSFLIDFLPNLKMDYQIEVRDIQQNLIFSAISDFADPFLKINIQFPDTFWHNEDRVGEDINRNMKLHENGWKIVTVNSINPKIKTIEKKLREII